METQADIAVLIVSWNVKDLVLQNIEALFRGVGTVTKQVIVIDNASDDGAAEAVREKFPEVRVIANAENRGFAAACNQGIDASHARHLLLLNPDMRVEPDAIQKTVAYLDAHPEVAVVGAKLAGRDGKLLPHIRRFPRFGDQLAILLKIPKIFPRLLDRYLAKDLDLEREQAVDSVRGSFFAINASVRSKIGKLDERYFLWFEEVDFCKQASANGWKVMYVPAIRAADFVGRSFAQRDGYWKQKQFTRSMVRYFRKWHPWWQGMALAILRVPVLAIARFL